ncbi:hypothetical protein ABZY81_29955 [Streptomyces sp. NPDC006514]|uniref:hypothetical protein n=1 Tax=Streptomyces sp. NPDC006514 TaxID=3154308 RepID=UPI0033AD299E
MRPLTAGGVRAGLARLECPGAALVPTLLAKSPSVPASNMIRADRLEWRNDLVRLSVLRGMSVPRFVGMVAPEVWACRRGDFLHDPAATAA